MNNKFNKMMKKNKNIFFKTSTTNFEIEGNNIIAYCKITGRLKGILRGIKFWVK